MSLPVAPLTLPRDLEGLQNGKLPEAMLVRIGNRGLLHPLAARAWRALCAAASAAGFQLTYTFGGTYRSFADQRSLFVSRYQTTPLAGRPTKVWEGVVWYQRPNTAIAAVPGTSNHGLGLAVDTALDHDATDGTNPEDAASIQPATAWMVANVARFGWSFETQSEPWHIRYVAGDAVPAAVLEFERPPIVVPFPPPAVTPTEEDDMRYVILAAPERPEFLFVVSGSGWRKLCGFRSPADRDAVAAAVGAQRAVVSVQQFDDILTAAS